MSRHCEYLIIGQGIAGSLLAAELLDAGKTIRVIDRGHQGSSSQIAAGIINPITGRRFVKSWRIDELLPFALKRFRELSDLLNCAPIIEEREILRVLFSAGEENEWLARTAQEGWSQYVAQANDLGEFKNHIQPGIGQGILKGAQVDMPLFIKSFRQYLENKDLLIERAFDSKNFDPNEKTFQGITFDHIVFCEGARARFNPLWKSVTFEPAKGEIFHLRIPGLKTNRLLKHQMMLAPLGDEVYWFGANYEWNADHESPSDIGRNFLQKRLDRMLINYEEVGHFAAIRPTIKDRRPVLGRHPEHPHCIIFNGLGTKGASLGPFLANNLRKHLLQATPLYPDANINRFY